MMSFEDMPQRIKDHLLKCANRDMGRTYEDNRLSVTELVGCLRKAYFKRKDPRPVGLDMAFYLRRGILFDEDFTSLFPRNQVRVTHRINDTPIVIAGKFDFINDENEIVDVVADLKTMDNLYWIEKRGPKDSNMKQVIFYCYCEGKDAAELHYVSMGNWIRCHVDAGSVAQKDVMDELEQNAKLLYGALVSGTPPEIDGDHNEDYWECQYEKNGRKIKCEYYEVCYGGVKDD